MHFLLYCEVNKWGLHVIVKTIHSKTKHTTQNSSYHARSANFFWVLCLPTQAIHTSTDHTQNSSYKRDITQILSDSIWCKHDHDQSWNVVLHMINIAIILKSIFQFQQVMNAPPDLCWITKCRSKVILRSILKM